MSVTLGVFAPGPQVYTQRALPLDAPGDVLGAHLERVTGIPPASQHLALFAFSDVEGTAQSGAAPLLHSGDALELAGAPLAVWGAHDGMLLRVSDRRPGAQQPAWLRDADQVEKYEMPEEEYAARTDSVRAFKKAHALGRFAPDAGGASPGAERGAERLPAHWHVGSRCLVDRSRMDGGDGYARRGTIAYLGTTQFAPGNWVGVAFDEPVGKNDGSVGGVRYFAAAPKHGGFVRAACVEVGDYPPELDAELEEM